MSRPAFRATVEALLDLTLGAHVPGPRLVRLITTAVTLVLGVTLLGYAAPASAATGNATGAAAGSPANGFGYLKVRLSIASDGGIAVQWTRPVKPSKLRGYVVRVGTNRKMDSKVQYHRVSRRAQSAVVPQAFGATPESGNFSFVKVDIRRRDGSRGTSPVKWIQAPVTAGCPAGQRATVATYNVRTWNAHSDTGALSWTNRGPKVIEQIRASNASVVAIQEASGKGGDGFGSASQHQWIIDHLNQNSSEDWVDPVPSGLYQGRGLVGTRILYDATKYENVTPGVDSGLKFVTVNGTAESPLPWVRLRPLGGGAPFIMMATHLASGAKPVHFTIRGAQVAQVIAQARSLHNLYGDEVIVGGDMNSTSYQRPYDNVHYAYMQAGFYDAFATTNLSGSAFPTTNDFDFPVRPVPHRRDYILTYGGPQGSCGYRNQYYRSASDVASDHFLQVATVPIG